MKKNYFLIMIVLVLFSCKKEGSDTPATPAPKEVNVYVSGSEGQDTVLVAKYWKNGQAIALSDGTNDAWVASIAVAGSNVYVAGTVKNGTFYEAKYWKNGQAIALTNGTRNSFAFSIVVAGSDVYVAGSEGGFAK